MAQQLTIIDDWTKCLACYAKNHAVELWLLGFPIDKILVGLSSLGFNDISSADIEALLTETGHDTSIREKPKHGYCQSLPSLPNPKILNQSHKHTSRHRLISPSKIVAYWKKGHTISDIQMNLLLAGAAHSLPSSQEIIDVLVNAGYSNVNSRQALANNPWKKYQFFAEEIELAEDCSCAYSTAQVVDLWKKGYTVPDIAVQLQLLGYEDVFVEDIRCQLSLVGYVPGTRSEEKGAWRWLRRKEGVRFRKNEG